MRSRCFARSLLALGFGALLVACGGKPSAPARWAQGGATLEIPWARWSGAGDVVEIHPDGSVTVDGDVELWVDRVGRVYDAKKNPVGLLETDGRLVGLDNELLGMVGSMNAALPGQAYAFVTIHPQGQVIRYERNGKPSSMGTWHGCNRSLYAAQTCVLVTYALASQEERDRARQDDGPGVGVGIGVGVGVPIR